MSSGGKPVVHLHGLYHIGPSSVAGVVSAIAVCGARRLPKGQFTADVEETTCSICLQRAKGRAAAAPPMPVQAPPSKAKGLMAYPPQAIITMAVKRNIRKPGSGKHARFQVLLDHHGKTYAEYIQAGGNPETLRNAVTEAVCEVRENDT
jgi:hypothetical protein